jgi:phage baseplate assembly protein V
MNDSSSFFARLLEPLRHRIALMVRRAVISLVNDGNPVQTVQLKLYRDECRNGVERVQEYGTTSVPLPDCQAVAICVDGECGHGLVIAADDRRYRPMGLNPGDLMHYTKANLDGGHHIYYDAANRLIRIKARKIVMEADEGIDIDGGNGEVRVKGTDFRWKEW